MLVYYVLTQHGVQRVRVWSDGVYTLDLAQGEDECLPCLLDSDGLYKLRDRHFSVQVEEGGVFVTEGQHRCLSVTDPTIIAEFERCCELSYQKDLDALRGKA